MNEIADMTIRDSQESYEIDQRICEYCDWGYDLDEDQAHWSARLNCKAVVVDVTKLRESYVFDESQIPLSFVVRDYVPCGPPNDPLDIDCWPVTVRFAAYHMQVMDGRTTITYEVQCDD